MIIAGAQEGKSREGAGWNCWAIIVASNKGIETVGGRGSEEAHDEIWRWCMWCGVVCVV